MARGGRLARRGKVTVRDIAREAGVSPTTVSLALRGGATSRVSPATRRRVQAVAERLDYQPNYIARSLVTQRTHALGLVVTTLINPFYAELAQDIIVRARERGFSVFTCSLQGARQEGLIDDLLSRGVDGLIICSVTRRDPVVAELHRRGVPFVLAMRRVEPEPELPPTDCVVIDNRRGAFLATDHLLALGHRRVALLAGPEDVSTGYERRAGYQAALTARGIKVEREYIIRGDFSRTSGHEATRRLLRLEPRPTALFAVNDHMAVGALAALGEAGLRVPEEMAVVGFDDIEMAGLPGVDLTTISQKKSTMGRLAVDRLADRIEGRSERVVTATILDPILVVRRTCGQGLGRIPSAPPEPA